MKIGEVDGLKIFVSPEEFEEIKKQKIIQENKILEEQQNKIDKYEEVLDKIKETIKYYAVENEDYSKIYNQEEQEIIKLLEEIE